MNKTFLKVAGLASLALVAALVATEVRSCPLNFAVARGGDATCLVWAVSTCPDPAASKSCPGSVCTDTEEVETKKGETVTLYVCSLPPYNTKISEGYPNSAHSTFEPGWKNSKPHSTICWYKVTCAHICKTSVVDKMVVGKCKYGVSAYAGIYITAIPDEAGPKCVIGPVTVVTGATTP